jgi:hypothetical protein
MTGIPSPVQEAIGETRDIGRHPPLCKTAGQRVAKRHDCFLSAQNTSRLRMAVMQKVHILTVC